MRSSEDPGGQFGKDFEDYKNREDQEAKSESGFLAYLERVQGPTMTRAERNKRFRSYLFNAILEDADNRMAKLISDGNRGSNERLPARFCEKQCPEI